MIDKHKKNPNSQKKQSIGLQLVKPNDIFDME